MIMMLVIIMGITLQTAFIKFCDDPEHVNLQEQWSKQTGK